ncbi:uncharacterized protein LOC119081918 isoform X3 [Bradysia coprophila]|uniref:uncharacterized protein LOC119081918 isoform X3 n=1 Tax=Bradysia coprophila TaxID=38358 RepID=UPI00187DA713|nr:uncharacterized protein LOC119081918 isoform X3 [Bradysia coprophila]
MESPIYNIDDGQPKTLCNLFDCVMTPEEAKRTQRPYRYGMLLLCFGALINWVGLAENYTEPIRYAGVACILLGAMLICTAMCCWLRSPGPVPVTRSFETDEPIHVITVPDVQMLEKPPEYDSVVIEPPSYDHAIKLSPSVLLNPNTYKYAYRNSIGSAGSSSQHNDSGCCTPLPNQIVDDEDRRSTCDIQLRNER